MRGERWALGAVALAVMAGACGGGPSKDLAFTGAVAVTTTSVVATTAAPGVAPAAPATTSPPTPTTTSPAVPAPRRVTDQPWTPFAVAGGGALVLYHPATRVERVGFHEANHDGARDLEPLPTAASPVTLEGRDRGTGPRTSADVVVDPEAEIRAPVSGRVLRSGTYVLYCDHSDDYAVIEPDARPGWEVKVLHIDGVRVRAGARVEAGRTVLARRATMLPFESQVDEATAKPSWPHVHLEVVDPSIPDRPSGHSHC